MAANWIDAEAPLRPTAGAALRRLRQRGRASWRIWVTLAIAASAAYTFAQARKPPRYGVTVVLRASEGPFRAAQADFGTGTLRSYVQDVVFSNRNLVALMRKHPETFRGVEKDAASELEDFRRQLSMTVEGADHIQERGESDPPRSARVALTFHWGQPDVALTVAHDLAELVTGAALAKQRAIAEREQAAAEVAKERAGNAPEPADSFGRNVPHRLHDADSRTASADIAMRALENEQGLRFQVVDPGHAPPPVASQPLWRVGEFLFTLAVALLAFWLLAGAFDPRVLDAEDLVALGLPQLGRVRAERDS